MAVHYLFHRLLTDIQSALRVSIGWKVCFRKTRRILYPHFLFTGYGTMFNYPIRFRMVEQVMYAVGAFVLYLVVGTQIDATKPDSWFWYALSLLLASALIIIIWKFANKVSGTLDELKQITSELAKRDAVHDNNIEHMKADIIELKDKKK